MAIARIHNNNTTVASGCPHRRRRSSASSCAHVQRILKRSTHTHPDIARTPLSSRTNVVDLSSDASPQPIPARSMQLLMPRVLPRPSSTIEIDTTLLSYDFPELTGVTPEYIRGDLMYSGSRMFSVLSSVTAHPPKASLPKELEITVGNTSSTCPTHMIAISSTAPTPAGKKRQVKLYPTHHIILAANCANLPKFPPSSAVYSSQPNMSVPVVPIALPSPNAFPLLHQYLYTKNVPALRVRLCSQLGSGLPTLLSHAGLIHGVWANACALGVVDHWLFETIDMAWEGVINSLQFATKS